MSPRLVDLEGLADTATGPSYDRRALQPGIVHLGAGAFFRAHTAAYTDAAIAAAGGDWGIEAASLRTPDVPDRLAAQNGLYTLLLRDNGTTTARVIGSVISAHVAPRARETLLGRLADPAIRVVSLTVTEKAYGIDPVNGGLDASRSDIATDLVRPLAPATAVGILVEGLARRWAAGAMPFTPLCCDNLPANGKLLRRLVLDFAARRDPALAAWIAANVPFPSTMVDRITPASTDMTLEDAERLTGRRDLAAVEAEPFAQWVIEDDFASGRPRWDAAGAIFVADVSAYEEMKLRMLNGTHSLIAYLGVQAGHRYMRDVMADAPLAALARRHMKAAAATLETPPKIDLDDYADALAARFANRSINHLTAQVAADGTQKLPQRLFVPATQVLAEGGDAQAFALATAAWMRHALGVDHAGCTYQIDDPRADEIAGRLAGVPRTGSEVAEALFALPGLFPEQLLASRAWTGAVADVLDRLICNGPHGSATPISSG